MMPSTIKITLKDLLRYWGFDSSKPAGEQESPRLTPAMKKMITRLKDDPIEAFMIVACWKSDRKDAHNATIRALAKRKLLRFKFHKKEPLLEFRLSSRGFIQWVKINNPSLYEAVKSALTGIKWQKQAQNRK